MRLLFLALLMLSLFAVACRPDGESAPPAGEAPREEAPVNPKTLYQDPAVAPEDLTEFASLALPAWRALASEQPTLVLLSQDPLLFLIPDSLRNQARELALRGSRQELSDHGAPDRPEPYLLPVQTLRAALDAGLFARVLWVLPVTEGPERLDVELFRQQLLYAGQVSEEEAATVEAQDNGFRLRIAGIPIDVAVPSALPEIDGPVVLHVDLSHFQNLYRNEVKTPVFELMRQALSDLYGRGWDVRAATHSLGQAEGRVTTDMRFLGHRLTRILAAPAMLERPLPPLWQEQAEIIYLATFLEMDKVLEKAAHLAMRAPQDAPAHFELYRALRARRAGTEALAALARAVALDPGYAAEYLNLAALARGRELPEQELEMLEIAKGLDPANPFVGLRIAELQIELGAPEQARRLLDELSRLPWSPVYFPDVPELIESMKQNL